MTDLAAAPSDTPTWTVPTSLSPSRVESFLSCPLAFRFSSIENCPTPDGRDHRGSLVHRALEHLFTLPAGDRTPAALDRSLDRALAEYRDLPDYTLLGLDTEQAEQFGATAASCVPTT
ncbi:MAG: PD-(D/E)XK nuclease family protein [Ilumatobacteraceae bacterium]